MCLMKIASVPKIGTKFGEWIVISNEIYRDPKYNIVNYLVKCSCGVEKKVSADFLRRGKSTCCIKCKNKDKILKVEKGQRLGDWLVLSSEIKNSKIFVQCKCGRKAWTNKYALISGATKGCYSCGNERKYRGYNNLSKTYFSKLEKNAKKRNIKFNITIEEAWDLFIEQKKLCSLSKIPIELSWSTKKVQTASLDRIDSSKEYVIGNVQWVHKDINKMKNNFNQDYFVQLCKLVAKQYNNESKQ